MYELFFTVPDFEAFVINSASKGTQPSNKTNHYAYTPTTGMLYRFPWRVQTECSNFVCVLGKAKR